LKKRVEEAGRLEVQDVEFGLGRLGGEYSVKVGKDARCAHRKETKWDAQGDRAGTHRYDSVGSLWWWCARLRGDALSYGQAWSISISLG